MSAPEHWIVTDDADPDCPAPVGFQMARVVPANQADVDMVLAQPVDTGDGRSPWHWIRFRDGTLVLATFPQGDTYMAISDPGKAPFYD